MTKLHEASDAQLVGAYVKVRDEIAAIEAEHKEVLKNPKSKLEKIEIEFLRRFQERDAESVRTSQGTAYRSTRTSATVADWDAFFNQFVVPNQAWDFIERRANKTMVVQYKGEHGDIPPGLNWREEAVVGFRRA